ncbi:MAG: hypothetical protein H6818_13445 [Phycisphaerales bacterium]|nr:hypothetical protein [Phycisphaerales bacterium]MCB9862192.1 hypothetical protein [Phycisphaerales bacterium]
MPRPDSRKLIPLAILLGLAIVTFIGSLSVEVLTFRVILTESGLYFEGIFDDIKTTRIQFASPRGRFWSAPGVSIAWPMFAVAIPHWLHIAAALAWPLWPRRRNIAAGKHCLGCGYNLNGNESGKCPECGVAMKNTTQPN